MVYRMPKIFPTSKHQNMVIVTSGVGAAKDFSCLVTDAIPNYHMHDTGQCFPLYWYEKIEKKSNKNTQIYIDGYIRHDGITDWALEKFRNFYHNNKISKEDIFWYVYGILHSSEYKKRFSVNFKKMIARIPLAKDFHIFSGAGRKLGKLHLNYEKTNPYLLVEESKNKAIQRDGYRITRMTFGKKDGKPDKSTIIFNNFILLRNIPIEAYDYVVNGKSAIEWIVERYQIVTDKVSDIKNDPNAWSDDPRYILDLVKRIVTVSVESVEIIKKLPPLLETKSK
jgi:predicted helicase